MYKRDIENNLAQVPILDIAKLMVSCIETDDRVIVGCELPEYGLR